MITIRTVEQKLSDFSKVYNVRIEQDGAAIELPATGPQAAVSLSSALADAISLHTVEIVQEV